MSGRQREEDMEEVAKAFRVTGRVQGVFYRAWTQTTAKELGLSGTVRNRRDGAVEAHVRGPAGAVAEFESRLWEGSPNSLVEGVNTFEPADPGSQGGFRILPTA
jgi:acylphosphatase